jgi:3-oxoacyl-[acyl-carrier-protein] synthase I
MGETDAMHPVAILNSGMVTGVGFSAPASCAAIRAGITGFVETRFMFDGEWMIGCPVPFEHGWRGRERLLRMVVPAIEECLAGIEPHHTPEVSLLLCVAEQDRPGRIAGMDDTFFQEVQERLGRRFHSQSYLIARGRIGGVQAVDYARRLLAAGMRFCIVAGVDSYLVAETLRSFVDRRRVLTAGNSDGLIPGEAAAAVLLASDSATEPAFQCRGIGYGTEPAPVESDRPLRADGLVAAFRGALAEANLTLGQIDYRITDLSGEQYGFKEAALALIRVLRQRKQEFDLWHPADCIGEVGAAAVPAVLAVAMAAAQKGYAPGRRAISHFAADTGERAAMILDTIAAGAV